MCAGSGRQHFAWIHDIAGVERVLDAAHHADCLAMFGGQETATFLSKTTTYLAVMFMVLSLALALLSSRQGTGGADSVIRRAAEQQSNVIPQGQSIDQILGGLADTTGGATADTSGVGP